MRILGLDASTKTVGICILDFDGYKSKIVHQEYYKPDKTKRDIEYLLETSAHICGIIDKYDPDKFAIEDYVKFMKSKSSAATTISLALMNTHLRCVIFSKYNQIPESLNVLKIRHAVKLDKKLPTKEDIPDVVAKRLEIDFPWYYKTNRRTKQQQIMEESYDVADAIAVCLAVTILLSRKTKTKRKSK
jgi:Holliday junction resolvasome RuvABC endonuclease subunit